MVANFYIGVAVYAAQGHPVRQAFVYTAQCRSAATAKLETKVRHRLKTGQ